MVTDPRKPPAPDLSAVWTETWADVSSAPGPHVLCELGRCVFLGVAALSTGAVAAALWVVVGGVGMLAAWLVGALLLTQRRLAGLGLIVTFGAMAWGTGATWLLAAATLPFQLVALLWLSVGAQRAAARRLRAGEEPSFGSALRVPAWLAPSVAGLALIWTAALLLSSVVPLVPLLLAALLGGFLVPAMALDDVGLAAAIGRSARAMARDPGRFFVFAAAALAVDLLAIHVWVVGPAFGRSFRLRAARALLADG
jgi:hypothetical protein